MGDAAREESILQKRGVCPRAHGNAGFSTNDWKRKDGGRDLCAHLPSAREGAGERDGFVLMPPHF